MSTSPERDEGTTTGLELVVADMQNQNSPASVDPTAQNMSVETYLVDGTPVHGGVPGQQSGYAVGEGSGGSGGSENPSGSSNPNRRRRGRPRRYGPDGSMPLSLMQGPPSRPSRRRTYLRSSRPPSSATATPPPATGALPLPLPPPPPPPGPVPQPHAQPSSSGRQRARPNYQQFLHEASGSEGFYMWVRILVLPRGEDISARIMEISQHGRRPVCVICGCGCISAVTIRELAVSGGTVTYEGMFQLLCLTGSFVPSEFAGRHVMTGGLNVVLHGQGGQILGGSIAGHLVAATPVLIWVATPVPQRQEGGTVSGNPGGAGGAGTPPSQGPGGGPSGGDGNPQNPSSSGTAGDGSPRNRDADSGGAASPFDINSFLRNIGMPMGGLDFGLI